MDRARELDRVSEDALIEAALDRLKTALPQFEAIRACEKRRKIVVASVINAVVNAALAALSRKAEPGQ